MTYFNPANTHFSCPLRRRRKLAGEIPTRNFPVRISKQPNTIILWKHAVIMIFDYPCCIWTAISSYASGGGKPRYPLLRNLSFCVSLSLPLPSVPAKPRAVIESFEAPSCHEPCVVVV